MLVRVAVLDTPNAKRIRTYSPDTKASNLKRRNIQRQLASTELQTKWLNGELNADELEAFNKQKEAQTIANLNYKSSGKQPFRSPGSLLKRKEQSKQRFANTSSLDSSQAAPEEFDLLEVGRIAGAPERWKSRKPKTGCF